MPTPNSDLVRLTPCGLYCEAGDFFVDPWRPVDRAVITHAHSDHARRGHARYLATRDSERVLRLRLGDIALQCVAYGEPVDIGGVRVSLHPAGHVLGSAQVRIEYRGEVWVLSGDYKLARDATCAPFEPVHAHTFVTESTFGLPVYRWRPTDEILRDVNDWWRDNADAGRASVLFAYAFGKAQRVLAGLEAGIGPIACHGAVEGLNAVYRESGVPLPPTLGVADVTDKSSWQRALIVAPPSAQGTPWLNRFGQYGDAFASGWMQMRGARRRNGVDRGFVLSDHADWPALQTAIRESGAGRVFVTHGYVPVMVRWLAEQGLEARAFETEFGTHEDDRAGDDAGDAAGPVGESPA